MIRIGQEVHWSLQNGKIAAGIVVAKVPARVKPSNRISKKLANRATLVNKNAVSVRPRFLVEIERESPNTGKALKSHLHLVPVSRFN